MQGECDGVGCANRPDIVGCNGCYAIQLIYVVARVWRRNRSPRLAVPMQDDSPASINADSGSANGPYVVCTHRGYVQQNARWPWHKCPIAAIPVQQKGLFMVVS